MNEPPSAMSTIYTGWQSYQGKLTAALTSLSPGQLALRVTPNHRSLGEIATHLIGARARWFGMEEGENELAEFTKWDRAGMPVRTATELVDGLEATWQGWQAGIARWTPADWEETFEGEPPEEPERITRMWVIWHLIEHDLHHGGEISLILGMHGLPAPDI